MSTPQFMNTYDQFEEELERLAEQYGYNRVFVVVGEPGDAQGKTTTWRGGVFGGCEGMVEYVFKMARWLGKEIEINGIE